MRRLVCNEVGCKHHGENSVCTKSTVEIINAKCNSFEKGFLYYISMALRELGNSNFIPVNVLTEDIRLGLYYVMEIYNLSFSECEYGTWRMVMLKKEKGGKGLTADEILQLPINQNKFELMQNNCNKGIFPNQEAEKPKKENQPFGWLSPMGEFTEGDWGEHEHIAYEIIKKKQFHEEFRYHSNYDSSRDFLSEVKGYCLIHNPFGDGGYIVSHVKPLTKQQKEFLYTYFMDIGDRFKAEQFVDEYIKEVTL